MTFRDKIRQSKEGFNDRLEDARAQARMSAINQFYQKVMKEDGITYEECLELCKTDPKYSLGVKLQIYMVDAALDVRHKKKHLKYLQQSLTPEEKEIYENEVVPMKMGNIIRAAVKKGQK